MIKTIYRQNMVLSMKKKNSGYKFIIGAIIFIIFLLILGVNLLGPHTTECEQFSVVNPEGFHDYSDKWSELPYSIDIGTGYHSGEVSKSISVREVNSSGYLPGSMEVTENYTEGDLTVLKGHSKNLGNCTCAEIEKDGRHFLIILHYTYGDVELSEGVKLIKEVIDSMKLKEVSELEYWGNGTNDMP